MDTLEDQNESKLERALERIVTALIGTVSYRVKRYKNEATHTIGQHTVMKSVNGWGTITFHAANLDAWTVQKIAKERLTAPYRCVIAFNGTAGPEAISEAAKLRVQLYKTESNRSPESFFTLRWTRDELAWDGTIGLRVAAGPPDCDLEALLSRTSPDRILVFPEKRLPTTLREATAARIREVVHELGVEETTLQLTWDGTVRMAFLDESLPLFVLGSVMASFRRNGKVESTMSYPLHEIMGGRLIAIGGTADSLDMLWFGSEPLLDRSGDSRCGACWHAVPMEFLTKIPIAKERLRSSLLLDESPAPITDSVECCTPCANAIEERNINALERRRFDAVLPAMRLNMSDGVKVEQHLSAIHAALLNSDEPLKMNLIGELAAEYAIRDIIVQSETKAVMDAIMPAIYSSPFDQIMVHVLSHPYGQLQHAFGVLATSPEPSKPVHLSKDRSLQLRGALEALFECRLGSLMLDAEPEEILSAVRPENLAATAFLAQVASGPRGTTQQIFERMFNLGLSVPHASQKAFNLNLAELVASLGVLSAETKFVDVQWLADWADRLLQSGASAGEYHRFSKSSPARKNPPASISWDIVGRLVKKLALRRGSVKHPYQFGDSEPFRLSPIMEYDDQSVGFPPMNVVLRAIFERMDGAAHSATYSASKGPRFERRVEASLNRLPDLRFVMNLQAGSENDFIVVAGDVVLCLEAKDYSIKWPEGNTTQMIQQIGQRFRKCVKKAVEQASGLMDSIRRDEIPMDARAIGVDPTSKIVLVAVTGEDFGEAALRPELLWPERPSNSVILSGDLLESSIDAFQAYGLTGADFGRYLIERTLTHDILRAEEDIDYVRAFIHYGSLHRAAEEIGSAVLRGGLDWSNELYRKQFWGS